MATNEAGYVTEIPSYLKQLARLISYAFYSVEDSLIIDVLVRHPCMKEKDIEDLLKFDLKLLRARMATLKTEKLVQLRLRMETGMDGKAQKVNYYFINYKSLVNVIKYKLDHMRKKMETQERDATNRASFKCSRSECAKSFTDLEAGELFNLSTGQFQCTFCGSLVEEDDSAGPQKDSRLMLARFNEQMELVYELLRKAEDIKLAPELLEPEPPKSAHDAPDSRNSGPSDRGVWSGEATRLRGINDQTRVDIRIGDAAVAKTTTQEKSRPIWMTESSIGHVGEDSYYGSSSRSTVPETAQEKVVREDIMSVLLAHEQQNSSQYNQPKIPEDDSSSDSDNPDSMPVRRNFDDPVSNSGSMEVDDEVGTMESDDDDQMPLVTVGTEKIPLTDINEDIIAKMSATEKEAYIQQYQEFYSHLYD